MLARAIAIVGDAITPTDAGARAIAVDSDHPDPAAVAAGSGDRSRTVDDSRRLQNCVERDPQQALSRTRNPSHCRSAATW